MGLRETNCFSEWRSARSGCRGDAVRSATTRESASGPASGPASSLSALRALRSSAAPSCRSLAKVSPRTPLPERTTYGFPLPASGTLLFPCWRSPIRTHAQDGGAVPEPARCRAVLTRAHGRRLSRANSPHARTRANTLTQTVPLSRVRAGEYSRGKAPPSRGRGFSHARAGATPHRAQYPSPPGCRSGLTGYVAKVLRFAHARGREGAVTVTPLKTAFSGLSVSWRYGHAPP